MHEAGLMVNQINGTGINNSNFIISIINGISAEAKPLYNLIDTQFSIFLGDALTSFGFAALFLRLSKGTVLNL